MVPLVVLIILDGWGIAPKASFNAITQANTPNINSWSVTFPHTTLTAAGVVVGLPRGEPGNTETGHLNLGAGRIVYQDLLKINMGIADDSFFKNTVFLEAIEHCKKNNSKLGLMGLIGSGGVHANNDHLFALLKICKEQNFSNVYLHLFTDGRDSPPTSAVSYIMQLEEVTKKYGLGKIASVMGRYWAMDRDLRWERTEKAYRALTEGIGRKVEKVEDVEKVINEGYEKGVTDEFINPIIVGENGQIQDNDAVIFYNFRIDRPRQLTRAFIFEDFEKENTQLLDFDPYSIEYHKTHLHIEESLGTFARGEKIKNLFFVTMTEYEKITRNYVRIAFPPTTVVNPLGGVLSAYEKRQLRIAESEKERFVTFYFNGQQELTFEGEVRKIVPSKKVGTYDKLPEMSAYEITDAFLQTLGDHNDAKFTFVLINFANADMVGHTGNFEAAIKACEVVDECLGKIVSRVTQLKGVALITGDHGNAEHMKQEDGTPDTEHTGNTVPFLVIGEKFRGSSQTFQSGILWDVAPTILKLLGIPIPSEMTGRSLI